MTAMHRIVLSGLALGTGGGALLIVAASSWADLPPQSAAGRGVITSVETVDGPHESGGNRVETRRLTGTLEGALTGSFLEEVRGVVHSDGTVRFKGTGVFEGALEGCGSGTAHLRFSGGGQAGAAPGLPSTVSQVRVVNRAANTLPVTGQGTITQEGADLTYDITFHCRE